MKSYFTSAIQATIESSPVIDIQKIERCHSCDGSGEKQPDVICKRCEGTGIENHQDLIETKKQEPA